MQAAEQPHTYKIRNINFIVTSVYKTTDRGEPMHEILLKLLKTETEINQ